MLQAKKISKSYGGKVVLDNISMSVNSGEIAILIGPSGAGKSTMLRILAGLETPDCGEIVFSGNSVGMIFQEFNLFSHLSVKENITISLEKVLKKSRADADDIATKLLTEYGLEDKIDNAVSELSGGQKQRLAIARTIAMQPEIICMDEPTSALDSSLTSYVAESIKKLSEQGFGVVLTTHDQQLLNNLPYKSITEF